MTGALSALFRFIDPAGLDLFEFWRWLLAVVCTVYAAVVSFRSLAGWMAVLSGPRKTANLLRRYLFVQLLRLRVRSFSRELLLIAGWSAAFAAAVAMHRWT